MHSSYINSNARTLVLSGDLNRHPEEYHVTMLVSQSGEVTTYFCARMLASMNARSTVCVWPLSSKESSTSLETSDDTDRAWNQSLVFLDAPEICNELLVEMFDHSTFE